MEWADPTDPKISQTDKAIDDLNAMSVFLKRETEAIVSTETLSMIKIGLKYNFTLKVRDFLQRESPLTSLVVTREDKTVPDLSFGAKNLIMKRALGITLQGKIYHSQQPARNVMYVEKK